MCTQIKRNPKGLKMKDIRVNVVGKHRQRVKRIVYDTANFGSVRERKIHADLMLEILSGGGFINTL